MRYFFVIVLVTMASCGGTAATPTRRVIESDIADWHHRRFQALTDVEVWLPGNQATGYTASYARADALKVGRVTDADVVSAFVSEYEKPDGLRPALIRFARRLAQETGYLVDERRVGGQRVFVATGHGEAWAYWPSGKYIVKVGGRGLASVPGDVVKEYGKRYPSQIVPGSLDAPIEDDRDAGDEGGIETEKAPAVSAPRAGK